MDFEPYKDIFLICVWIVIGIIVIEWVLFPIIMAYHMRKIEEELRLSRNKLIEIWAELRAIKKL